jgi:hypothetical protein
MWISNFTAIPPYESTGIHCFYSEIMLLSLKYDLSKKIVDG